MGLGRLGRNGGGPIFSPNTPPGCSSPYRTATAAGSGPPLLLLEQPPCAITGRTRGPHRSPQRLAAAGMSWCAGALTSLPPHVQFLWSRASLRSRVCVSLRPWRHSVVGVRGLAVRCSLHSLALVRQSTQQSADRSTRLRWVAPALCWVARHCFLSPHGLGNALERTLCLASPIAPPRGSGKAPAALRPCRTAVGICWG
jgi:hypothetical protein